MKLDWSFELVIPAFGELPDEGWEAEIAETQSRLRHRIAAFGGNVPSSIEIETKDIGRGADWTVLAMSFVAAAVVIPEVHKRVRESIEEWRRIYDELNALFTWVLEERTALFSDEFLFLRSVEVFANEELLAGMEYKGMFRLPQENPTLQGYEDLMFSFSDGRTLLQVAVSRSGVVMWKNSIHL